MLRGTMRRAREKKVINVSMTVLDSVNGWVNRRWVELAFFTGRRLFYLVCLNQATSRRRHRPLCITLYVR